MNHLKQLLNGRGKKWWTKRDQWEHCQLISMDSSLSSKTFGVDPKTLGIRPMPSLILWNSQDLLSGERGWIKILDSFPDSEVINPQFAIINPQLRKPPAFSDSNCGGSCSLGYCLHQTSKIPIKGSREEANKSEINYKNDDFLNHQKVVPQSSLHAKPWNLSMLAEVSSGNGDVIERGEVRIFLDCLDCLKAANYRMRWGGSGLSTSE